MQQREDLIKQILEQIEPPLWSCWIIKEKIGVGSFSEVYRLEAEQNGNIAISALKIEPLVSNRIAYSKEDKEQYIEKVVKLAENEINIMYQLKGCPNIVQYEEEQRTPFYCHKKFEGYYQLIRMEFLFCIADLLQKEEFDLSENNIKRFAVEIGNGICAAHKKGIMHRDIKPENLFVSEEKVYKLGDFNVSKQSEIGKTIAGTSEYMAPEIYYKSEDSDDIYTKQTDIYSFGITLYYLMNGLKFPLEDTGLDSEQALVKRMMGVELPLPKNASIGFGRIIQKACSYKVEERFQTIEEMITEIEILIENEKDGKESLKKEKKKWERTRQKKGKNLQRKNIKVKKKRKGIQIGGLLLLVMTIILLLPLQNKIYEYFTEKQPLISENLRKKEKGEISNKTEIDTETEEKADANIEKEIGTIENDLEEEKQKKSTEEQIKINMDDFIIKKGVLKQYIGKKHTVRIPEEVTAIGEKAFVHRKDLKNVIIPNSVKSIGFAAFAWCRNLESVDMSENVTAMEKNAFRGCEKLKSIVIPRGIKKIKLRTFQDCKSLKSIKFSEGIEIIGCLAFDGCKKLKELRLPNSVKKVDTWAFQRCKNLESAIIPNVKTKVLWKAFDQKKSKKLTIYCSYDSKAEAYAKEEKIPYYLTLWFYQEVKKV